MERSFQFSKAATGTPQLAVNNRGEDEAQTGAATVMAVNR
jgi:hypothetical protein